MTDPDAHRSTPVPLASFAAALAGLAVTVTGCAPVADGPLTGPYVDGEYHAAGEYRSPAGLEIIEVTVTLESDLIQEVHVEWTDGDASAEVAHFQGEFNQDIVDVVIGVDIDEIVVDRVGGSSLTSGGFNEAIEQIKALAKGA